MHMKGTKLRVGIVLNRGTAWLGGLNYFRNLLTAVHQLPNAAIEPVILTGRERNNTFVDFPPLELVRSGILDPQSPAGIFRRKLADLTNSDKLVERLMNRHGVSILSHSFGTIAGPTVGWIPDFQHVYLPDFFSEEERRNRDRSFMALCERCEKVIVSSECTNADLQKFAPQHMHKAAVLQFVASPKLPADLLTLAQLQQKYKFGGPYFLLPNQFWIHKNHRVVISALKLIRQQGKRVFVIATGSGNDHRSPEYFDSLMDYARESDVLDLISFPGVIPFEDLAGLMQYTIAFINPSRFEGWSTTVEEAKSLGKRIILSDIPVHHEQSPEAGLYFHPDDPEALAASLLSTQESYDLEADAAMQDRARKNLPMRLEKFATTYQSILLNIPVR